MASVRSEFLYVVTLSREELRLLGLGLIGQLGVPRNESAGALAKAREDVHAAAQLNCKLLQEMAELHDRQARALEHAHALGAEHLARVPSVVPSEEPEA